MTLPPLGTTGTDATPLPLRLRARCGFCCRSSEASVRSVIGTPRRRRRGCGQAEPHGSDAKMRIEKAGVRWTFGLLAAAAGLALGTTSALAARAGMAEPWQVGMQDMITD